LVKLILDKSSKKKSEEEEEQEEQDDDEEEEESLIPFHKQQVVVNIGMLTVNTRNVGF